jgi:enamine deaminase RidA (YjgF/YER057c/UK114 family)
MKTTIDADGVWSPRERGFSKGVVQPEGRVIHFTGQVAWDENEQIVGEGDVAEQTRQCFRNIERILVAVGGGHIDGRIDITLAAQEAGLQGRAGAQIQ